MGTCKKENLIFLHEDKVDFKPKMIKIKTENQYIYMVKGKNKR